MALTSGCACSPCFRVRRFNVHFDPLAATRGRTDAYACAYAFAYVWPCIACSESACSLGLGRDDRNLVHRTVKIL
ncbi:MAG: hypothetical protein HY287_00675 [Planctomycetes bacterium]|nr:hypothetical protein [Planctomycetota bacterium]